MPEEGSIEKFRVRMAPMAFEIETPTVKRIAESILDLVEETIHPEHASICLRFT